MKSRVYILLILISILSYTSCLYSQEYVGLHKNEIKKRMNEEHKMFKLNTSTVNKYYNYIKYEDKVNEITIMFFLSDKDYCTLIRYMSDYSNINDIVSELNSKYKAVSKDKWQFQKHSKTYSITLEEGDWFFTVTTKEVKH